MARSAAGGVRELSRDELTAQLRELGVEPGGVLLVHASFRAVRPVEGGPRGLIEALRAALGPRGTLVMPSMTEDDDRAFDPATTPARSMGIVADTFWRLPGVLRSNHFASFAASGPQAARITADHPLAPPHGPESPVGRVLGLDGRILLLGVGHDANTTIHLAEHGAGVPYRVRRHCTVLRDGRPHRVEYQEIDHCCQRFALADRWLGERGRQHDGPVGHAPARLARARDVVNVVVDHLAADPLAFLHPRGGGCAECDEAWQGVRA
ncbi:MAG TPA: AAC(3) family N-acetyltransferase [Geminicoccaceae bacterium]|nr:AAC(3) family N-acetyltransferase [Geminicoccaceae bacterium]